MNVTKENIDTACDEFELLVPSAAFVSIDLEMTGIHLPDCKEFLDDTPAMRYSKMRKVASRFNIVQVGITMFHRVGGGDTSDEYIARTYNVFTFPAKGHQITLEGGAVEFLVSNGMDWNAWFRDGVPYLRKGAAKELKAKLLPEESTENVAPPIAAPKPPMELDAPQDKVLCAEALAGVAAWWDGGANGPAEHVLPACNSYLRRFLFQECERIYSDEKEFSIESRVPDPAKHWEKEMVAIHRSAEECEAAAAVDLVRRKEAYRARLGFTRMWAALTASKRPIVVHNGLFDLLFLCRHMHDDLPTSLVDFKELIGELFPGGIFDTRNIGKQITVDDGEKNVNDGEKNVDDGEKKDDEDPPRRPMFPELRLDRLYALCKSETEAAVTTAVEGAASKLCHDTRVVVKFAENHDRYLDSTKAILHEAGYDSYITAFSFAFMRRMTLQQRGAADLLAASVGHLADCKFVLPLYRSFFPGVCLAPGSDDVVNHTTGEQQHLLMGFPSTYQTSDVLRLFTARPVVDGDVNPRVSLHWINDMSVCARFSDADTAVVLTNLDAHRLALVSEGVLADSGALVLTPLQKYMQAKDEEFAAAAAAINETDRKRPALNSSAVEVLPTKKTKVNL